MNYRKIYLGIAQNINIIVAKAKESHANILTSLYSLTNFSIFSSFSFSVPLFIFLPLSRFQAPLKVLSRLTPLYLF
jgi:hypothetical protein